MRLDELQTFVIVAERGTLTAAARELGVPKSTVSRRVARLEDELGVALVRRSARSLSLTEFGEHLRMRSAPALRELAEAERSLQDLDATPRGLLRLTAPADLGTTSALTRMFLSFREKWPGVNLDIDLTDRVVDLVGEGFDIALRPSGPRANWSGEGLKMRSLGKLRAGIFASPTYLQRHGAMAAPEDLLSLDWIAHRVWFRQGHLELTHTRSGEVRRVQPVPAVTTNHIGQVLQMVLADGGVGAVPQFTARRSEREGELVQVLPDWQLQGGTLSAVWPATRHLSPRVRAFIDFAAAHLADLDDFA